MNKKNTTLIAASALCAAIILSVFFFLRRGHGDLTLVNDSGESVIHATMEINGTQFRFDDIEPGGIRRISYKELADNHYKMEVEFRYDRKLEPQQGFFSGKVKEGRQLVIKLDGVVLEAGK